MDEQSPGHRGSHTMQKASKPKSSAPRQRRGGSTQPPKSQKSTKQRISSASRSIGAATYRAPRKVGMRDLMAHEISFLAGYVYVGNGTLGATDGVYYENVAKNKIATPYSGGSATHVPILPGDAEVGASYVKDIDKHFARKRIRSLHAELHSLQPATSNSMVVQLSPVRGAGSASDTRLTTGTTAGATLAATIAMDGSKSCTSWEGLDLDLTPFIAGGSGAKQNEFNNDAQDALGTPWDGQLDLNQVVPACLVVAGQNNTTALRGTQTHMIVIRIVLDYLDFIADAVTGSFPSAVLDIAALMKHVACSEGPAGVDRILRHIETDDPKLARRVRALVSGVQCT